MADFQSSITVNAARGALFEYLSDVGNLPSYFARMTSATRGRGDEVHTTAQVPGGTEVEGDAWFRVDQVAHRIDWGSEGPHDYHGSLQVDDTGGSSEVRVQIHTSRVPAGDAEVQNGIDTTLATIKWLIDEQYAIT